MPNLMVVGAHHDDCEWQASGLSMLLKKLGWKVRFLVVTNSAVGKDREATREEADLQKAKAIKSAQVLGIEKKFLDFLSLNDKTSETEVASAVAEEFLQFEPDILVCDWPRSSHLDHRLAGIAALTAWQRPQLASKPRTKEISEIFCYCAYTYGNIEPNFTVDINDYWDIICKALNVFSEFDKPWGNNLIFTKDKHYADGDIYWKHVEEFVLVKGNSVRITILADILGHNFRWLPHSLPEEFFH